MHVKLINIFWSRLYSAGSHISFSTSPAANKNTGVDVSSCVPLATRVLDPCPYRTQPPAWHLSCISALRHSPGAGRSAVEQFLFWKFSATFMFASLAVCPPQRGKVMGFRVALCCESALQVSGVALKQDLTTSVLSCLSPFPLYELSWWQVKSRLLSTANYLLFWLSSAFLGQ